MREPKAPIPIKDKLEKLGAKMNFKSDSEIEAWERGRSDRTGKMIKESTDQAKKLVSGKPHPHDQMLFSFMPTSMTRTSPFFPMSKQQMKDRPMEKGLSWETPWGQISVSGERLSVYDETVLLSLLVLVKKHLAETFETTQYELCKIATVNPCKNTYNAIWKSIDRLAGTKINIEIWQGKGSNRKLIQEMTGAIVSWAGRDHTTGKLKVVLNPYFIQMYAEGFLTNLDLKFRAGLKGDTSKALYRFFQGQQPLYTKGYYEVQILKLCLAINLKSDDVELWRLRDQIRKGLKELRKQGYLKRWQINNKDYVLVWKTGKNLLGN